MAEKEYIEREAVLRDWPLCDEPADAYQFIRGFPTADVRPVVKARWEKVMEQPYFRKHYHVVACSACHKRGNQGWNFCPNCGADCRGHVDGYQASSLHGASCGGTPWLQYSGIPASAQRERAEDQDREDGQ